jgi:cardiolipin synthase
VWSGGRNLADEYFVDHPGAPAWVDLSFIARGALAAQAHLLFERDWQAAGGGRPPPGAPLPHFQGAASGVPSQWVPSGPDHADDTVYSLLLAGAYQARRSIVLVTPYFVPDEALLSAWCMACRRGVRLTLLIPVRSNHRLADWARERALRALADVGGEVLLYPSMVHAKAVVIDGQLALCGSANLDGRSLFLNYELMTAFYGREQIAWLSGWIEQHALRATVYQARTPSLLRDVIEGVVRAVGFQL